MSLYMLGKIVGPERAELVAELGQIATRYSVRIRLDVLDDEDRSILDRHVGGGEAVYFDVCDAQGADATQLWNDCMTCVRAFTPSICQEPNQLSDEARKAFDRSVLGGVCRALLELGATAGVSLVDGGIEGVYRGSLSQCLGRIACDVSRTWDQSANRLYTRVSS